MKPQYITRFVVGIVIIVLALILRSEIKANAVADIKYEMIKTERDGVIRENEILRSVRDSINLVAADSIALLEHHIEDAEQMIFDISAAGRQTFNEIIESVPDSMPELRQQIELRERMHDNEIAVKDTIIVAERSISSVLRGQLKASANLLLGVESDLVLANDQIVFLERRRNDGLNNLESTAFGLGAYIVSIEVFGTTKLEGIIVGGGTYLVVRGGSKLIRWIF